MTELAYSLDTSALIDGIERFYPMRNFPQLWGRVDDLILDGRMRVSEEVWEEAQRVDAGLKDWCRDTSNLDRSRCVYDSDVTVLNAVGAITSRFPRWSRQGAKNGADPFVIAVAQIEEAQVISGEKHGGPSRPKIPYVCAQLGVPHGRLVDLIRAEDWVLG